MKSTDIILKLKALYNLDTDVEVADFLGISKQNLYNFKQKNTVDIQAIIIEKLFKVIDDQSPESNT